ncbi:hypothetical protein Nepgr_013037 [Nepenthes gracilis]|uniref:Uncharacterized protein n=1 Tax=Nepenthes gracilis TaxID=150966 RepID=A0AAD3SI64_NEPGR|nr:hypothetical protein Nepgr_013037 [Nepenthes gracilis]
MDALLFGGYSESIDLYKFNHEPLPTFLGHQISVNNNIRYQDTRQKLDYVVSHIPTSDPNQDALPDPGLSSDGDILKVDDFSDACLKYMSEILMEEDLEDTPSTLEDYNALQATEKALYDVLGETYYPPSCNQFPSFVCQSVESPDGSFNNSLSSTASNDYVTIGNSVESNWVLGQSQFEPSTLVGKTFHSSESSCHSSAASNSSGDAVNKLLDSPIGTLSATDTTSEVCFDLPWEAFKNIPNLTCKCQPGDKGCRKCMEENNKVVHNVEKRDNLVNEFRERKNHHRDDNDYQDSRSSKHIAVYDEEYIQMEQYDDVLLCRFGRDGISASTNEASGKSMQNGNSKGSRGRTARGKQQSSNQEKLMDLSSLLTHCAQAVASFDIKTANDLLKQIKLHSSPCGDSIQRLAHYFADGLEARLAGTGAQLSVSVFVKRVSSSDVLKANQVYARAIPFKRTSYFLANATISKLAETATSIHIIDFGIFYGFQWPCLIQKLSERANGPPKLRITGIDFPQKGFRPAKVVEETGRRLAGYCDRFNVPFEYHAIAQKWETIQPEDLKIGEDELVVVNCMFRARTLLDETVDVNSPRDAFLRLVKKINPDLFIPGIVNGSYNSPFFITRFKEALFYFSSVFDLFEATIPREDDERLLIERELYGKHVLNVIACEGAEREERPETYKQWQVRMLRAGFRQLPLDQELMNKAKIKVKANYHKDFVVGEDSRWMLQGWKGRILYALSCWKPA